MSHYERLVGYVTALHTGLNASVMKQGLSSEMLWAPQGDRVGLRETWSIPKTVRLFRSKLRVQCQA
jgi:hypothetical protein